MSTRRTTRADVARALWLLGLEPPVDERELSRAWRGRVAQTHPDLHIASDRRSEAATLLTTALNDARRVVAEWIDAGREWPAPNGGTVTSRPAEAPAEPEPAEAEVCSRTGLRRGDLVRSWPYDGEPVEVRRTEVEPGAGVWVVFADGGAERAERVRLAVYSCPVCGQCAGPEAERYVIRPCPECLADLGRLERRPADARRIRSAIEARSEAGRATAQGLDAEDLEQRAVDRRRWARRLREAGDDDLQAALLGAFGRAFERWALGSTPADGGASAS
jgi:hypothetical protein